MANEGFIKLYRKMLEWGWYDDGPTKDVFIHLLLIASYEDKAYRGIALERGQVVATVAEISKQTGLSRQQIRTAISKLISTSEVTTSKEGKYTVFTVKNYSDYQVANQNSNQQATNEQPLSNHFSNTKKVRSKEYPPYNPPKGEAPARKRKRSNEPKEAPDWKPERFAAFWEAYPCGKSKQAAIRAWDRLRPDDDLIRAMALGLKRAMAGEDWHPVCLHLAQWPPLGGRGQAPSGEDCGQAETHKALPCRADRRGGGGGL